MRNLELGDYIIGIAELLGVPGKQVVEVLKDNFKNISENASELLEDAYWDLQDDNIVEKLKV